jgi:predicted ATPase
LQEFVLRHGGGDDQFFMGARQTPSMKAEIRLETQAGFNDYRFMLEHLSVNDTVMVRAEAYRYSDKARDTEAPWQEVAGNGKEAGLPTKTSATAKTICHLLRQCTTYHFHDTSDKASIRMRWDVTDAVRLRSDGGNLAAVLLALRENHFKRYQLVVRQIQRVLPTFQDFVLEASHGKVDLRWMGQQSDKVFGPHLTSDGSLRLFCLLTLLNLPPEQLPDVMFFDEPELGLHPHAITLVAEMFKRVSATRQVFLATQSPYMVDCFDLENIIVASANNGETVLRNLPREHYQHWLDEEYQLSDIWLEQATGGVAWLGDSRPLNRGSSEFGGHAE